MHRLLIPLFLLCLGLVVSPAQDQPLASQVYPWQSAPVEQAGKTTMRRICRGSALDLEVMEVMATTLGAGQAYAGDGSDGFERLFIVKAGRLDAQVGNQHRTLSERSLVMVMPGDACRLAAPAESPVTFFELRYRSRHPVDLERGRRSGGSRLIEWTELRYATTDVGGRRQPFERVTAMFAESELHVTTLNPGLTTHAPHTHVPDEIVLMIRGETEMSIAGQPQRGTAGDLYFLGSGVPHNIHNVGTEPAEYYAFQWR